MLPQAWSLGMLSWFGVLPVLIAALALVGIVAVIFYALRQSANRHRSNEDGPSQTAGEENLSPREILQIRYVCGEINRDQYYEMLADLK